MAAVQQWFFGITLLRRGECDESHSLHFPSAAPRLEKLTTLALLCFSTSLKIDGLPSFVFPHFTTFWSSSANLCQWKKNQYQSDTPVIWWNSAGIILHQTVTTRIQKMSLLSWRQGGIPIWAIFAWKQPFLGGTGLDFRRMAWQRRLCNQVIIVGGQLLLPCLSTRTRSRGNTKLDFASGLLCRLSTFSKVIALAIGNYPFERIVRSRWWAGYSRCTCSCIKDPFSSLSLAAKRYPRDTGENWGKYSGNLAFSSLSWGSIALVCLEEENVRDPRECNNGRKTAALRQSLGCATSAHAFPGNISEHETSWVSDTSCIWRIVNFWFLTLEGRFTNTEDKQNSQFWWKQEWRHW